MSGAALGPIRLEPNYHERVWGGRRLSTPDATIGEAWIVWEADTVVDGRYAGRTLADVTAELGTALVGSRYVEGDGFPLLIKLLDTREWLSIQVHPNDELARQLEGEACVGKTEAWHMLDADPDAKVIAGLRHGATRSELATALREGTIVDLAAYRDVGLGDTIYVPAGTIHALGPGLFVYEVQQSSDLTYRVFDWNRPLTAGRKLHLEQTLTVADPGAVVSVLGGRSDAENAREELVASPYFVLERIAGAGTAVDLDTGGLSFHTLTATDGSATLVVGDERVQLRPYDTALVPAGAGSYRLESGSSFTLLLSRLP